MRDKIFELILWVITLLAVANSFIDKDPEAPVIAAIYLVGTSIYSKLNDKK